MRTKLSGWKTNILNLAGRATLISSTLSRQLTYYMQYTLLPSKTIKATDQIQRNFLWGTNDTKRKLHLISWDLVTKKKDQGELGLRKAKTKNEALLAWRLANNSMSLWAKNLITKYSSRPSQNASFIWKSIIKGWTICQQGMAWSTHNSSSLNIWKNKWIPKSNNLRSYVICPWPNKNLPSH